MHRCNFEMPRIKIYFGIMSLYGLTVGSGLEDSRSVFEVVKKTQQPEIMLISYVLCGKMSSI